LLCSSRRPDFVAPPEFLAERITRKERVMGKADAALTQEMLRVASDGCRGLIEGLEVLAYGEAVRLALVPWGIMIFTCNLMQLVMPARPV